MAQHYASGHLKILDERFFTESKTGLIVNKGIRLDFNGKKSVTIYDVDTVDEVDYIRNGPNRFGELVELGTGEQTFTLSQDKSFTFSIDRGNLNDSMMAQEVSKAVSRQVREVSIPNVDVYRLATLQAYAVANGQSATSALAVTDIYEKFLVQTAALVDAEVTNENLVAFMSQTTYNLLRRDDEVKIASDSAYKDVKTGVVTQIDGVKIVIVPSSYLPANTGFLIVADNVLVAPTKFDMVRTLDEVQGIDGWVAEGRRYYDAFIPANRGVAIRAHMTA